MPAHAASLVVSGGELTGATGVDVGGVLYDVEFIDGTCAALFDGCDSDSDLSFTTPDSAILAARALLDQVFVDGPLGAFDSDFALTAGCEPNTVLDGVCVVMVPYTTGAGFFGAADAFNYGGSTPNGDGGTSGPVTFDSTESIFLTFARFSPAAAVAVPEPATWATLLLGFFGMGAAIRSSKRRRRMVASHA